MLRGSFNTELSWDCTNGKWLILSARAPIPLTIFLYPNSSFQYFLVTHSPQHSDKDWFDSLTIILAPTFMSGTIFFLVLFTQYILVKKSLIYICKLWVGADKNKLHPLPTVVNQTDNLSFLSPWTQAANHQNRLLTTNCTAWTIHTKATKCTLGKCLNEPLTIKHAFPSPIT